MQPLSWSMTGESEAKRSQSANSCENDQRIRTVIKTEQNTQAVCRLVQGIPFVGYPGTLHVCDGFSDIGEIVSTTLIWARITSYSIRSHMTAS